MTPRHTTPQDLPALAHLWHNAWHEAHALHVPSALVTLRTRESFQTRLQAMTQDVRVIGPGVTPLGFCAIRDDEVYQLFTAPDTRGSGAAARLIQDAEARIAALGHAQACLSVIPQNTRAIRFYEKQGWHRAGIKTVAVDTQAGPFDLAVLQMTKPLLGATSP